MFSSSFPPPSHALLGFSFYIPLITALFQVAFPNQLTGPDSEFALVLCTCWSELSECHQVILHISCREGVYKTPKGRTFGLSISGKCRPHPPVPGWECSWEHYYLFFTDRNIKLGLQQTPGMTPVTSCRMTFQSHFGRGCILHCVFSHSPYI